MAYDPNDFEVVSSPKVVSSYDPSDFEVINAPANTSFAQDYTANAQKGPLSRGLSSVGNVIGGIAGQVKDSFNQEVNGAKDTVGSALGDAMAGNLTTAAKLPAELKQTFLESVGKAGFDVANIARQIGASVYDKARELPGDIKEGRYGAAYNKMMTPLTMGINLLPYTPGQSEIDHALARQKADQAASDYRGKGIVPEVFGAKANQDLSNVGATGLQMLIPGGPAKEVAAESRIAKLLESPTAEQVVQKYGDKYRQILAPSKAEINKIEINGGKDLDDAYQLAAKEKLVVEKAPDGKLDTTNAIDQLQENKNAIESQLSDAIASKPEKTFSLIDLGNEAKSKMRSAFKNDAHYEAALKTVDNEIESAVRQRGDTVNGVDLNEIKQGMWSKGYDASAPNANKIARIIGNVAKESIENAYKDLDIKDLNSKLGDYITLQNLLKNAHGRPIKNGKLGKFVAQGAGAVIGHSLGLPGVGELGGGWLGGVISDYMVDPERITKGMAKNIEKLSPQAEAASKAIPSAPYSGPVPPTTLEQAILDHQKNLSMANISSQPRLPMNVSAGPQVGQSAIEQAFAEAKAKQLAQQARNLQMAGSSR